MIRLVQITDTHIYADAHGRFDGVDTRASFAGVYAALRGADRTYAALVLSGDLAMDASAGAYAWLARALAGDPAQRFVLPGNHDDPALLSDAGLGNVSAPARVDCGNWRVWLLDTHVPDCAHGEIEPAQLDWLARGLDEPHAGWDAVFLHHHPLPIGSPWMDAMGLRDAPRLWSVLEQHDSLRAVAFGHVHQNFDVYRRGARVLGTPSTCVQFMPGAQRYERDARGPGYRVIDLLPDGRVVTEVVRVSQA